ncbi:hypothetical protein SAMN05660860_02970 [Geoalkalibacter ferrihydriticus]|uniref:Uncharacterized protein n=2 Tax=Geoalkalibacter ferrihydriticus TaxID=392333 RepID=A0A0C2HFX0_9BACT|nr:hypothetical protein [Geoalkalibacter ferrihydriticus]KIH75826.1 hypothetical protein GFER_14655 [Geoalkalibacter ferrihydriticus DSM 17813]SDM66818.1 hypothetical protein SAMN05660860_02970 [Geoalkalibacter ferrihydriticus]
MNLKEAPSARLLDPQGVPLCSLVEINRLAPVIKEELYRRLVPRRIFTDYAIDPGSLRCPDGQRAVTFICPEGLGLVRIEVRPRRRKRDCLFFVEVADTPYGQIELSLCLINDLDAPRYNVDVDELGRDNCFGTLRRNRGEELRAMSAGLAPNQVRRGLQMFSQFFEQFEKFVAALGISVIIAEPLSYDNAVRYEGYGFDYLSGKKLMLWINEEFQPGGLLFQRLNGESPFRRPGMEKTVRGRSWAIHDGILGRPWDGVKIYKTVGQHAGVNTFSQRLG